MTGASAKWLMVSFNPVGSKSRNCCSSRANLWSSSSNWGGPTRSRFACMASCNGRTSVYVCTPVTRNTSCRVRVICAAPAAMSSIQA